MSNPLMMRYAASRGGDEMRYEEDMEMRRRRDGRGRYMEADPYRIKYNGEDTGYPEFRPYQPGERGFKNEGEFGNIPRQSMDYGPVNGEYDKSMIGYGNGNYEEPRSHYGKHAQEPMMQGRAWTDEGLDRMTAERWVRNMGIRFPMEETAKWATKMGMEHKMIEFYAIMNAMWSDYGKTMAKHGLDTPDIFACLAKDWLEDEDAVPNKAEMYYKYIVQK